MFLAACAADIVHRNHFFRLYQQNKSSESKVKFRQASNHCKRILEAAKLAYANKQKSPSLPRNLALGTFGKLPIVFSKKVNLLYPLYSTTRRCSSSSDKAKLFAETFSKNSNLDDSGISLPVLPSSTSLTLYISVTHKMVEKGHN